MSNLTDAIEHLQKSTDLHPWYWMSYGEKCYAYATVEAFPATENAPFPRPGSRLAQHPEKQGWVGENGTEMCINETIAQVEAQNGDAICRFIAEAHAELASPSTATF